MTIVDSIRALLASSGLTPKAYEALLLYDMAQMRLAIDRPAATARQVVTEMGTLLTAGVCGEVANQLGEILLGDALGTALKNKATAALTGGAGVYETGTIGGQPGCWGSGVASLQKSVSSYFGFGDAVYIVNLGTAHRFILLKQGTIIETLQVWYDPSSHTGYTLADWLTTANTARLRRNASEFIELLGPATTGNKDKARELFQPITGPFLGDDHFDLSAHALSYAAVTTKSTELSKNLLSHHLTRMAQLD